MNKSLSLNIWWLESSNHTKFTEENVMWTEKHIFVKNVYKCVNLLKRGQNSIQDEVRLGRRAMLDSVNVLILANRKIRKENISEQLWIPVGAIHKILFSDLVFPDVNCRWASPKATQGLIVEKEWWNNPSVWSATATTSSLQSRTGSSDFHLVGSTEEFLFGTTFSSDDEMKSTVGWKQNSKISFLKKFIFPWEKCVLKN